MWTRLIVCGRRRGIQKPRVASTFAGQLGAVTGALAGGAYYEPTLLVGAHQASEIVQHETFEPVLVALPFDSDDEALALANDVPFGLAASAWTRDVFRAQKAGRSLAAGTVWISDHIPSFPRCHTTA